MRSTLPLALLGALLLGVVLGLPVREADSQVDTKALPPVFVWEAMTTQNGPALLRAKVPGGWFIAVDPRQGSGLTFYADPLDKWDGSTVPPVKLPPGSR